MEKSTRRALILGAASAAALAGGANAQGLQSANAQDLQSEIVNATKTMTEIMYGDQSAPKASSARIAAIACDLMTRIQDDPDLRESFKKLSSSDRTQVYEVPKDYEIFANKFLGQEERRLREYGIPAPMAFDLLSETSRLRTLALKHVEELESAFYRSVEQLKNAACKLQGEEVNAERQRHIYLACGGVVLAVADIGAAFLPVAGEFIAGASVATGITLTTQQADALTR
jgi:hypothetical protein